MQVVLFKAVKRFNIIIEIKKKYLYLADFFTNKNYIIFFCETTIQFFRNTAVDYTYVNAVHVQYIC